MSYLTQANKLKNIENYLEKQQQSFIKSLSLEELTALVENNFNDREREIKSMHSRLLYNVEGLENIKFKVLLENVDLSLLRNSLITLKRNIANFQTDIFAKFRELQKEEWIMNENVNEIKQMIGEYERPVRRESDKASPSKLEKTAVRKRDCPRMKIKWSTVDHNIYLKYKQMFKNDKKLAEKIHHILPYKSIEDIINYDNQFMEVQALREKQRQSIKQWRKNKEEAGGNTIHAKSASVNHPTSTIRINRQQNRVFDNVEIKQKIAEWKKIKEDNYLRDVENAEAQREEQRVKSMMEKRKNQEVRELVQSWRKTKEDKVSRENAIKMKEEQTKKQEKSKIALKLIKEFQIADLKYIINKRKLLKKEEEPIPKPELKVIAPDLERLNKPTKQWLARIAKSKEDDMREHNLFNNSAFIPRMGVPKWRETVHEFI